MSKSPANKDFYLLMLEHGMKTLEVGVTQEEVMQYFKDTYGYSFDSDDKKNHFRRIFHDVFSDPLGRGGQGGNKSFMAMEAYFKLLEYIELTEARKASTTATYYAVIAICISIASMLTSVYLSKTQLDTPTKIEKNQMEIIKQLKYDSTPISKQLKELQESQNNNFKLLEKSYNK